MIRTVKAICLMFVLVLSASSLEAQLRGSSLADTWLVAVDAARNGDLDRAESLLEEIHSGRRTLGVRRLPSFANSAAGLAINAEAEGNRELADWAIAAAESLDPESPAVSAAHADLLQSRGGVGSAIGAFPGVVSSIMGHRGTASVARADLAICLASTFVIFALGLGLILIFKVHRVLMHDAREVLSKRFGPGSSTVLAFAFMILPVLLWLSPLWLVPWWLMITFRYSTIRERIVVALTLTALALAPMLYERAAFKIASNQRAIYQGNEAATTDSYDPEVNRRVAELLLSIPDSPELNLLAGNLALIEGNDAEALDRYQRAVELDESYAGAHLNIGNIHFLQEDQAAATYRYEIAAGHDGDLVEAYINNSVVAGESFDFPRQTGLIDQAKSVNRSRADRLLATETPRQVHFHQLSDADLITINQVSSAEGSAARELFGNYASLEPGGALLHPLTIGSIIALLLALVLSRIKPRTASACVKCGRTFCHRCKSSKDSATYCTQCIHIYIKRDGVLATAKARKLEEVEQYHKSVNTRARLLSLVMPGSAQIIANAVEIGAVALFVFLAGLVVAAFSGHLAPIVSPAEATQNVLRILGFSLAGIIWILFALPALFRKVKVA